MERDRDRNVGRLRIVPRITFAAIIVEMTFHVQMALEWLLNVERYRKFGRSAYDIWLSYREDGLEGGGGMGGGDTYLLRHCLWEW